MRLRLRPVERWPGELTRARQPSPFRSTYSDTLELLDRELTQLRVVGDPVVQLAIREEDLRLDGELRANARPEAHPGVILSFRSRRHGDLSYPCDTFDAPGYRRGPGWHHNLRAIALGLEALRKVERYGIANRGQQYTGWRALGAGTPMPAAQMTVEDAARLLHSCASPDSLEVPWEALIGDDDLVDLAYRTAVKRHHPDVGGDPGTFRRLTEARELLRSHAA